jgi:hypothetical protein
MSEAIWQALTQKPRRFMGGRCATRVPGCRYDRLGYSRIWKSGIASVISMTRLSNPRIIQCGIRLAVLCLGFKVPLMGDTTRTT